MVNLADRNSLIARIRTLTRDRDNAYKQLRAMEHRYVSEFNRLNGSGRTEEAFQVHDKYHREHQPLQQRCEHLDEQIDRARRDLRRVERGNR